MFCKKGAFRNFGRLTGKHLCQSLFFNKVAGLNLFYRTPLDDCLLFRKDTLAWVFSVNFAKFLGTPFLTEHLWWLYTLRIQWRSGKIMNNTGSLTFSCYQIGHLEIVSLLTGHLKKKTYFTCKVDIKHTVTFVMIHHNWCMYFVNPARLRE